MISSSVSSPPQSHSASPSPSSKRKTPSKKSSPLPWTHQETLALIHAYQEKWYSLKKGQLKAFQWEEVSVTVAARYGYNEPSKTATQCRHKIEKLRKRYRSELQKPYPKTWQYFEPMDQMECDPMPLTALPITVAKSKTNNDGSNSSLHSNSTDYYINGGGSGGSANTSRGAATKNKSKSINNIVRGDVGSGGVRRERAVNEKRRQYYEGYGAEVAAEIRRFTERFMTMERERIEAMQERERYRMEMIVEVQRRMVGIVGRVKRAKLDQEY